MSVKLINKLLFNQFLDSPMLKSVTVRSNARTKVYKQKIAVSDNTTLSSLIFFAIKDLLLPENSSVLEYMPENVVREVITGIEHTEIIVSIEDG